MFFLSVIRVFRVEQRILPDGSLQLINLHDEVANGAATRRLTK